MLMLPFFAVAIIDTYADISIPADRHYCLFISYAIIAAAFAYYVCAMMLTLFHYLMPPPLPPCRCRHAADYATPRHFFFDC
jgi:hypothetical protein